MVAVCKMLLMEMPSGTCNITISLFADFCSSDSASFSPLEIIEPGDHVLSDSHWSSSSIFGSRVIHGLHVVDEAFLDGSSEGQSRFRYVIVDWTFSCPKRFLISAVEFSPWRAYHRHRSGRKLCTGWMTWSVWAAGPGGGIFCKVDRSVGVSSFTALIDKEALLKGRFWGRTESRDVELED